MRGGEGVLGFSVLGLGSGPVPLQPWEPDQPLYSHRLLPWQRRSLLLLLQAQARSVTRGRQLNTHPDVTGWTGFDGMDVNRLISGSSSRVLRSARLVSIRGEISALGETRRDLSARGSFPQGGLYSDRIKSIGLCEINELFCGIKL